MKYRKKPVVVEAVQFDGSLTSAALIELFTEGQARIVLSTSKQDFLLYIPTLEGDMVASTGDFIIKGVHGEFYPCKPDIFWASYEVVED